MVVFSSIPPQYVGDTSSFSPEHNSRGDVVIIVPPMDDEDDVEETGSRMGNAAASTSSTNSLGHHSYHHHSHVQHAICIETEADIEPNSPKTFTESSSK